MVKLYEMFQNDNNLDLKKFAKSAAVKEERNIAEKKQHIAEKKQQKEAYWQEQERKQKEEAARVAEEQHRENLKKEMFIWNACDTDKACFHGGIIFANNLDEAVRILTDNGVGRANVFMFPKGKRFNTIYEEYF